MATATTTRTKSPASGSAIALNALAQRLWSGAFALLPGGLVVYLAFNAGGYFPNTQGLVAIALLLGLAAWIAFAEEPFAGLGPPLAVAAGALAAYALWTLASATWSDSTVQGADRVQPGAALPRRAGALRARRARCPSASVARLGPGWRGSSSSARSR